MMQDTPTTFMDCAAIFKSGNTQSGVHTLTLPNTTTEVKVRSVLKNVPRKIIFIPAGQWNGMHMTVHRHALTHPHLHNLVNKTMHTSVRIL